MAIAQRLLSILASSAVLAVMLLISPPSHGFVASRDPGIEWRQIETDHFIVIYDSKQQPLGSLYAQQAEAAFAAVAPTFGQWPEKTIVLIDDSTDLANGYATSFPSPTIVTFPVLPTGLDVISDFGDWGLELLTHEYTHILAFEPSTGVFRPLRWIMGGIMRPNVFLPRWYHEGLAVNMETRRSNYGRLRSYNYLAIARAMVEEDTLRGEDIGRINENIPDWPGGNRAYLLGAIAWDEIIRRGGDNMIHDLTLAYSHRFPFLIDGPLRDRIGLGYRELLGLAYDRIETRAKTQIETVTRDRETEFKEFPHEGYFSHSGAVSPDGLKLIYSARAHNIDAYVMLVERPSRGQSFSTQPQRKLFEGDSITHLAWSADSKSFYYDNVDTFNRYRDFADLYRYDLKDGSKHQLTHGLRAHDAALSPDGSQLVFVQNITGSTQLAAVSAKDGSGFQVLYTPPIQTRVARPEFIDAKHVVFSERRDDGIEHLHVLTLENNASQLTAVGSPKDLLLKFQPAQFPRMTSEGLLFISEKSGAANVYLANRQLTDARAITNVTTRIVNAELDSGTGELLASRLAAQGPELVSIARSAWQTAPTNPPRIEPLVDTEWPKFEKKAGPPAPPSEDYNPWPHLIPSYWMPYGFFLPGGSYIQASTSAADPVGHHAYALTASYDSLTRRPSYFGQYTNATTRVPVTLLGEDINEYIYTGSIVRHSTSVAGEGSFYIPSLSEKWRGGLGYEYLQSDVLGDITVRGGPKAALAYSNATQKGLEISPEKGGTFSLAHSRYLLNLGNTEYEETDFSGAKYISGGILPARHVVALFANASIAPRLNKSILGRSTVAGSYQNGLIQNAFVMRGFPTGAFLGRNMISSTIEYRFPLSYPYRGYGTNPIFLRRLHVAAFVDALSLDGIAYDRVALGYRTENLGRVYFGTGAELKFDTTVLYSVPMQLIIGGYYGADDRLNPNGLYPFIGLGF